MNFHFYKLLILLTALVASWSSQSESATAQVVLRDYRVINSSVSSFDIEGVTLDDGQWLGWWEIHSAEIRSGSRESFDALKKEIGLPLLRIRQRVASEDFSNLSDLAQTVLDRCGDEPSNTARFAAAALCRGEIAKSNRESACVALLRMLHIERQLRDSQIQIWDSPQLIEFDSETDVCKLLLPIWFDKKAVDKTWKQIQDERLVDEASSLPAMIYAISLAIAAGDEKPFQAMMSTTKMKDASWLKILQAQHSLARREFETISQSLPNEIERNDSPLSCAILYHRGVVGLASSETAKRQAALLDLLQIPASMGDYFPEIAAACLDLAIHSDLLNDKPDSVESLKLELIQTYPRTFHALRLQNSKGPGVRAKSP